MAEKKAFKAPTGNEPAGHHKYKRNPTPYEKFMAEENITIYRGIGVYDVRRLDFTPWKRMGGRGVFLDLSGLQGIKGMYVVEVPGAGALNAERHFYDEFLYVVEGRGSTEVWREGSSRKQVFEWQAGSLFTVPINTYHRLVNASSGPAILLAATNAPLVMNIFQSRRAIFENPYEFTERYDESSDFFKANEELETDPVRGRALLKGNIFPDIVNCELPLDNQRAPGYKRIQPGYQGYQQDATTGGFIAEYPQGRYSKAHYHQAHAVLVCLKSKGYTFNWPRELGPRPWESGMGHMVKFQEYIPGGVVSAAPGGGDWFHQHFGVGKAPFRVLNFWGGPTLNRGQTTGKEVGEEILSGNLYGIEEGGRSIHYRDEDPHVLATYKAALEREGGTLQMPESLYR